MTNYFVDHADTRVELTDVEVKILREFGHSVSEAEASTHSLTILGSTNLKLRRKPHKAIVIEMGDVARILSTEIGPEVVFRVWNFLDRWLKNTDGIGKVYRDRDGDEWTESHQPPGQYLLRGSGIANPWTTVSHYGPQLIGVGNSRATE